MKFPFFGVTYFFHGPLGIPKVPNVISKSRMTFEAVVNPSDLMKVINRLKSVECGTFWTKSNSYVS